MSSQEELMDDGEYTNDEAREAAEAEVPEIDLDRAAALLGLVEKCANIGPMMSYIAGEAGEELKEINEQCRQRALARADVIRRQEAEAGQARQLELQQAQEQEQANKEFDPAPTGPQLEGAPTVVDRRGA